MLLYVASVEESDDRAAQPHRPVQTLSHRVLNPIRHERRMMDVDCEGMRMLLSWQQHLWCTEGYDRSYDRKSGGCDGVLLMALSLLLQWKKPGRRKWKEGCVVTGTLQLSVYEVGDDHFEINLKDRCSCPLSSESVITFFKHLLCRV